MDNLEFSRLTSQALAMMTQTYFFELSCPAFPLQNMLGNCRVVGFALDESCELLLLLLLEGNEDPDYYSVSELTISIFPRANSPLPQAREPVERALAIPANVGFISASTQTLTQ